MAILLLILLLCFYHLAKQSWKDWHINGMYLAVSAVVTDKEFDRWDLRDTSPVWNGSIRPQYDFRCILTLKADGNYYRVETGLLPYLCIRRWQSIRLYLPECEGMPLLLPYQRLGALRFALNVLWCLLCAAGLIWEAATVLQMQK